MKGKKILIGLALGMSLMTVASAKDYEGHWAEQAIEKWHTKGVIYGEGDQIFNPRGLVTRAQLATFIDRLFMYENPEQARVYTDIVEDSWYEDSVLRVTSQGIMYTPGNLFLPAQPVTRQEVAYALARAYKLSSNEDQLIAFEDDKDIDIWAKDSVQALAQSGYLKGYPDGTFKPKATITRAEFVTLIDQIVDTYLTTSGVYEVKTNGNVVIQASDVTLKNAVINGNVYITSGVGEGQVSLDHVTVNGCVYIMGGKVDLSGDFNQIEIESTQPINFKKGVAKTIKIIKDNTHVTLHKDTLTHDLVIGGKGELILNGRVERSTTGEGERIKIKSAGVTIDGQYVPLKVSDDVITLNVMDLIGRSSGDTLQSIIIHTETEKAYIQGFGGAKMYTNQPYTFKEADNQLQMIEEMIEQMGQRHPELNRLITSMGMTSDTAFSFLTRDGMTLSLRYMLEQYQMIQNMARHYMGIEVESAYDFTRNLYAEGRESIRVIIRLEIR